MSFTAYLVQPFQNTHENEFFRSLTKKLSIVYKNDSEKGVFIGNLSCGGHLLDAVFIRKGKIIIIDFKDYGGKVIFSENNPWKNYDDNGKLLFVAGGGGIRNPYQQLNAYRRSLMDILSGKQQDILSLNHIDVRWDHINCMVLFHRNVEFEYETMSERIKRFFSVSDFRSLFEVIDDRYSSSLELNDNEIENILKVLDIRPENQYNPTANPEPGAAPIFTHQASRFGLLKKMINSEISNKRIEKRLLNYYYTLIALEKYKEPEVKGFYEYSINWSKVSDEIEIDFKDNSQFEAILELNKQGQFPSNIFIGIKIKIGNEELPLLQHILLAKDLTDSQCKVSVNNFDLYTKPLEERELPEDIIEELVSELGSKYSIKDKLDLIKEKLEIDLDLLPKLVVGLNKETTFTAQLSSELNQLIKRNNSGSSLFQKYLRNEELENQINDFQFDPFIKITPLNGSQNRALKLSFNQPITVVTGPPGTGKTQLVLNIIANAIVNNKTLLFASKNNKAVDNVKEKLDIMILEKDYILRFGPKDDVKNKTKPIISSYVSKINTTRFETNDNLSKSINKLHKTNVRLNEIKGDLKRITYLTDKLAELDSSIQSTKDAFEKWASNLVREKRVLFFDKNLTLNIDYALYSFTLSKLQNFDGNFLKRIWFTLFLKNKYFGLLHSEHSRITQEIRTYIDEINPLISKSKSLLYSLIDYIEFVILLSKESIQIKKDKGAFISKLNSHNSERNNAEAELNILLSNKEKMILEKENLLGTVHMIGLDYLNNYILHKLDGANKVAISNYNFYIPDNIPWREEEVDNFGVASKNFLKDFSTVIVTNLAIKNGFPLTQELFDYVVIDEASQCDIASSIPLVFRAKQLVIIGDPLQLKHITKVDTFEEKYILEQYNLISSQLDYVNNSLYDYCYNLSVKSKYESILLNEHYRSHRDIIEFSNQNFYLRKLGQELIIKTQETDFIPEIRGITWYNVEGSVHHKRNINNAEIEKCIKLAEELSAQYPNSSIGITTPFRNQAKKLFDALPDNLKKKVIADTVHRFQGDEKDIMIFSLVITADSSINKANWINYNVPYLLNVGITRAKCSLFIIGDFKYCKSLVQKGPTPLSKLANYVESLNRVKNL